MAFLFVNKHSNAVKQENEADKLKDARTQQVREALRSYITRSQVRNNTLADKNARILEALLD